MPVNIRNEYHGMGSTPLHEVLDRGKFDIAQLLVIRGANLDTFDRHGESLVLGLSTYFLKACGRGCPEQVHFMPL
jgi:ankyrin repeat protein